MTSAPALTRAKRTTNPMTRADRVLSTPTTNTPVDTSRRRFLSQAAVGAAGGAALGVALPLPGPAGASERVPDPILAAIELHKLAAAATLAAHKRYSAFEEKLSANERLQRDSRLENETRRGEEIETALEEASHAELVAA